MKSGVWEHFTRDSVNQTAICLLCKTKLKCTGGSTKSLHVHLQSKHGVNLLKRGAESEVRDDNRKEGASAATAGNIRARSGTENVTSLSKFFASPTDNSLEATIARMTACDGLPFRIFATSPDMRRILMASGFRELPKSSTTVQSLVMDHGRKIRSLVASEIACRMSKGEKFSLTFDEWTSSRNRRYMVVNLHEAGPKFWSLGLVRIHGTMPAKKCVQLLEERLKIFGLSLSDDIVGICTDGASVMCKVGKLIDAKQQLCYAHGVQLAVIEVLYKKQRGQRDFRERDEGTVDEGDAEVDADEAEISESGESAENEDNDINESGDLDDDGQLEILDGTDNGDFEFDAVADLSDQYQNVVTKVRKIVKIFRKSPTKNDDILQKYVTVIGKDKDSIDADAANSTSDSNTSDRKRESTSSTTSELNLILDVRTRWSSLLAMLERFQKLRTAIQKALIDVNMSTEIEAADFLVVDELVETLQPVALAVEAICRRDVNLISAEAALQTCLTILRKSSSELSKTMAITLEKRLLQRYSLHSGVLHYLHAGKGASSLPIGPVPSKTEVTQFLKSILLRLDKAGNTSKLTVILD